MASISGAAARTALSDTADGAFKRSVSLFRNFIQPGGDHPPEANRYHLYVSTACPWASRCLAVLYMKGLEKAIGAHTADTHSLSWRSYRPRSQRRAPAGCAAAGVSITHPTWARTRPGDPSDTHCGWQFRAPGDAPVSSVDGHGSFPCDGCVPDDVTGARFVRDLYEASSAGCPPGTRFTVPVLWDKVRKQIVNNESSEIVRMFNADFNAFASRPELDLYPPALRADIDAVNERVYNAINNGVYKAGFATKQAPYEAAVRELYEALDWCEGVLSKQRFIAGTALTEADIRLFVTLVRFDEVYVVYFKCNVKAIREYPAIREYCRDVYQTPGVKESVDMVHIKTHYFTSHPHLGPWAIVPVGPGTLADLALPHGRAALG